MIKGDDNMKVTGRDFRIAHDIWGKDVTSLRGKTRKKSTAVADQTTRTIPVAQQQQVLSVDIMFVDSIPSLLSSLLSHLNQQIWTRLREQPLL